MKQFIAGFMTLIMACSMLCAAAAEKDPDVSQLYKDRDVDDSWDADAVETITLSEGGAEVSDPDILLVEGNTVTILEEGDYLLTGEWKGQIVVKVTEEEKVRLILQNVSIDSPAGPAILETSADKLVITLDKGSRNFLADQTGMTVDDDTAAAAIYAQDDLSINGEGTLVVEGRVKNGIHSKADLVIASGDIQITSENDAVKGRNSVLVLGGKLSVKSSGDGITSNREGKDDRGWVIIAGGTLDITTGYGAVIGKQKAEASRKGIKAATDLTILDGEMVLDAEDDGIHAMNVTIAGGKIDVSSGDDALQADERLRITGGEIVIRLCKEETKGEDVEIAEGIIRTDDP